MYTALFLTKHRFTYQNSSVDFEAHKHDDNNRALSNMYDAICCHFPVPFEALYVNMSVGCLVNYSVKSTICLQSVCLSCQPQSRVCLDKASSGDLFSFLGRYCLGRNFLEWSSFRLSWQTLSNNLSVFSGRQLYVLGDRTWQQTLSCRSVWCLKKDLF